MTAFNEKAEFREYPVNKDFGDDESFFRIITEAGEVILPKLQFQLNQPLPDTITCRVKGYKNGVPRLSHNMAGYVNEFYADGVSQHKEFEFKVIGLPDEKTGAYRLVDERGLIFRLYEPKMSLSRGQSVKCKFEVFQPYFFKLKRSASDALLPMLTLRDLCRIAGAHPNNTTRIEQYMHSIPELEMALDELNHGRPSWVISAMRTIRRIATSLFRQAVEQYPTEVMSNIIKVYKRVLLHLLEGSNFLRNVTGEQRTDLQDEITAQLEQLDIFTRTLNIISNKTEKQFINRILLNLKESGYIYHPSRNFAIIMHLFRISPELVNYSLGGIFDALMGWDKEIWKNEPFRKAFVDQFEIYINDTRDEINRCLQPQTPEDNEKIEKVLTAIAVQTALALPTDDIDRRLNLSTFYRYISLLRSGKADVLLNKSYLTLMGVVLPTNTTWTDIKEPTMMMTRATVDPPANAVISSSPRYYFDKNIEVEIGRDGITIINLYDDSDDVLPAGILPWPGAKIHTDLRKGMTPSKLRSVDGHAEFWNNVENSLFRVEGKLETIKRRKADLDDEVRIIIDKIIPSATDFNRIEAFHCHIVDEHFEAGDGYLKAEDIVSYNLHATTIGTFRFDDGSPMQFDATVIGIDENDKYHFSLIDTTRAATFDMANTNETCYCVITRDNGNSYSAISERGFGLYINKESDESPAFHRGNIVLASITGYVNGAVQSVIEDGPIDNYVFSNARALHNMLMAIAIDPEQTDESPDLDEEDSITRDDMKEVVEILRYKAVSLNDNILTAFDYLSLAHILATIIHDDTLATTIKAHKDILLLCEHYAKNKQIFPEDVIAIKLSAPESILIQRLCDRLLIVGALGRPEENDLLWKITRDGNIDLDRELARTVLSYNLLYEHDPDDPAITAIKDRIANKLNVSSEQRKLKYYGSESQFIEFKSSLVYPAGKGRSGISSADPDRQEYEILHIIAGFLNTSGGTLYIGVADDHYERGLEDDLKFYRLDTSDRNTKFRRSIKSLDNIANYLQNLIDSSFNLGKIVGEYAKVAVDDESTKGVVMVKIDPCPRIVKLNDEIFVRHGAKTEPLISAEEKEIFIADRNMIYKQLNANAIKAQAAIEQNAERSLTHQSVNPNQDNASDIDKQTADTEHNISTSIVRPNVLHEWTDPEHFVQPACYLRFMDDCKYIVTNDEYSVDEYTDILDIALTDSEKDDYLLMIYEDEHAIKVKMRDLLSCAKNTPLSYYGGKRLVFVCPVAADGALYSLHVSGKGSLYERLTPIADIVTGSMMSSPQRILQAPVDNTPMYEYIYADKIRFFDKMISTDMKRNQIGALAKVDNNVIKSSEEVRENLLKILK